MTSHQNTERTLQSLAGETVRLGRDLEQEAHAVNAGGTALDFGFVSRSLRQLGERQPFYERDDALFASLIGILDKNLAKEVVGTERRPIETHYDEMGQSYEVREVPVYTERG